MAPASLPVTVVGIVGYGRSGSTLLDAVLGTHPKIISVGELVNLPRAAWLNGEYCACGEPGNECPFWLDVRKEWQARSSTSTESYLRVQKSVLRKSNGLRHFLLPSSSAANDDSRSYLRATFKLYEAIAAVSNKRIIVDSSKLPVRARHLAQMENWKTLHLTRDPRGVAHSLARSHEKDLSGGVQTSLVAKKHWRTGLAWRYNNQLAENVAAVSSSSLAVRFEEFLSEPERCMQKLASWLGVDPAHWNGIGSPGYEIRFGHTVAGNRVRMKGVVSINPEQTWSSRMSKKEQTIVCRFAGPLARKYGYCSGITPK